MQSFWNSFEIVNKISIASQWIVAIGAIFSLVFTFRATTLKDNIDITEKNKLQQDVTDANMKTESAKEDLEMLITTTRKYEKLVDSISQYHRSALDLALQIISTNPTSIESKYLSQVVSEKGSETKTYLLNDTEGKVIFESFTNGYYKDISLGDSLGRIRVALHQIRTSNHLLEVTWGFITLSQLTNSNIPVYDFEKVDNIYPR